MNCASFSMMQVWLHHKIDMSVNNTGINHRAHACKFDLVVPRIAKIGNECEARVGNLCARREETDWRNDFMQSSPLTLGYSRCNHWLPW